VVNSTFETVTLQIFQVWVQPQEAKRRQFEVVKERAVLKTTLADALAFT
jgi:hypothetical protein